MIFELIKIIYNKGKLVYQIDDGLNIVLSKWLSYEKNNLPYLRKTIPFLFWVSPTHYFYLLYFSIPRKSKVPFLKSIKKTKTKENKLLDKAKYVMNLSSREMKYYSPILEKTLLEDKKHWKKELGVK